MKLIILFNPSAGRGKARRVLAEALDVLRSRKAEFCVRESRNATHLTELAHEACRERPDAIVSAGGDGTHHYIFNGLAGSNIPLGLLSLGSGNDFADGMGVPCGVRAAIDVLLNGHVREIDLARVGGAVYGCLAGAGFDSVVTRYANEQVHRLHGSLAYAWALLRCLKSYRPEPLELESEDRNFSGDVLFAVVGNNVSYGGGLKLTPRARLDDGLLDVCIVPYMAKLELLRWVPSAYRGRHLNHPRIIYFQTRRITLRSASRLELFGDGEFMQELPATIEVAPRALRVLVPSRA
ncbi:MAG: diacylglycerol kinase family lipid kinase [Acidobacteriia bacterium]|nr:diacylglycerol kinase family lipid kinase [Terriglobia bacterium]